MLAGGLQTTLWESPPSDFRSPTLPGLDPEPLLHLCPATTPSPLPTVLQQRPPPPEVSPFASLS